MDNRGIVLEALLLYEKKDNFADRIIKDILDSHLSLSKTERSFINRLFTGTVERKLTLDYIIDIFSTVKTNMQKPVIRNILRMSAYQIVFMDSVPDRAAINEAVNLCKKKRFHKLSGFVNAVLRKISENSSSIDYKKDNVSEHFSVKYSCPEWICAHFINELGENTAAKVLENSLKTRPLTIRTNVSKISKDKLKLKLESEGLSVKNTDYASALIIDGFDRLSALEAFNDGFFTVQDISSQHVIESLDINTDGAKMLSVIDVCASPGGKTCHIADRLLYEGINSEIIARDISVEKIEKINENIKRCGFDNVKTQVHDALKSDEKLIGKADIVIADLPCSGLGVISRKVDIKYRLEPGDLQTLSCLQRDILKVVSQYVKPGGQLVYSTCTVNRAENEYNAEWIENNLPFKLCKPYVKLLNDNEMTDGFFIAVFKRR